MDFEEAFRVANTAVLAKTKRNLKDVEAAILLGAWEGKSYYEIADVYGYSAKYLTQDVGSGLWKLLSDALGEKVSKKNFKSALERQWRLERVVDIKSSETIPSNSISQVDPATTLPPFVEHKEINTNPRQDWGEAVDVSVFYGRTAELATLEQWILRDRCRLVGIFGIGGIGKSALSIRSSEKMQHEFDYLIWRSLLHAPPVDKMLEKLIYFLSSQQNTDLPETISDRVSVLINYLRSSRCLLVLDNFESILRGGEEFGHYLPGYEGYGELLRRVGETHHQSCLVLTSREKPEEIALLEGEISSIRSLQLTGLSEVEGQEILKLKGLLGSEGERKRLIKYYGGNPLQLKIVSASIRDLFAGNIANFIEQGITVFNGVRNLLEQQHNRLSELEKQIMYWLAINREPVSSLELQEDILTVVSRPRLLEAMELLRRRSLVERCSAGFTLQTVVMDYITEIFLEQVFEEIKTENLSLLISHALIKAEAKDYIREIQNNLILQPLIDKLIINFVSKENIKKKINNLLLKIREKFYIIPGYASGNIINLLVQLKIDLTGYDFSNLTIWQAYLKDVNLHHVNFSNSDLTKSVFAEKLGGILSLAFSPDGQLLVTSDTNGEIHLWQIQSGKQIVICKGSTNWTFSVAFSPLGNILASGNLDKTVKLWNVYTGQCLTTLTGHTDYVYAIAFSPDGEILATGSYDQTIKLWHINDGKCLKTLTGHAGYVQALTFVPQRNANSSESYILASGSQDNLILLWDVGTGKCLKALQGHSNSVSSVAFSPEGQILASASDDHTVKLWDVGTGKCLNTLQGHSNSVSSVAFSPEGQILASGSYDQTVKLWDVGTGKCLNTLQGHSSWVSSVAFSREGEILASGSYDQAVKLWDIRTSQCLKTLQGHTNRVFSIAFAPQSYADSLYSHILVSGSEDCKLRLWDVHTAQCLKTIQAHSGRVSSISFSPLGLILASGSEDSTIKLWDFYTGECIETLQGHTNQVLSVAFSPLGNILASAGNDYTVKLWDISAGECLNTLQGHTSLSSVAFSSDGKILASSSHDQTVKLWDVGTGQCLQTLREHSSWVSSVAFSPNGEILASGSRDQTVKLWDVNTGQCLQTLQGHSSWVSSVAFSPNGEMLATSSHDQTAKLWDVDTGQCLQTLQGHSSWISSVAFSSNGEMLATSSLDGMIMLWNVKTREYLKTLRSDRPYERMIITGATGLTKGTTGTLKALGAINS